MHAKTFVLTTALATLVFAAQADESKWSSPIPSADGDAVFQIKKGSFVNTTVAGKPASAVVFRVKGERTGDVDFGRFAVLHADCARERGVMNMYDAQDNPVEPFNFVFGGGSVASMIAERICAAVRMDKAERAPQAQPTRSNARLVGA